MVGNLQYTFFIYLFIFLLLLLLLILQVTEQTPSYNAQTI